MEVLRGLAMMGLVVFGLVSWFWWRSHRSGVIIDRWASEHGCRVITKSYCWFFAGPFFMRNGRGQTVYRIVAEDEDGCRRRAHVRCGSWLFGLLSDAVAVEWDGPWYGGRPHPQPSEGWDDRWDDAPGRREGRYHE